MRADFIMAACAVPTFLLLTLRHVYFCPVLLKHGCTIQSKPLYSTTLTHPDSLRAVLIHAHNMDLVAVGTGKRILARCTGTTQHATRHHSIIVSQHHSITACTQQCCSSDHANHPQHHATPQMSVSRTCLLTVHRVAPAICFRPPPRPPRG